MGTCKGRTFPPGVAIGGIAHLKRSRKATAVGGGQTGLVRWTLPSDAIVPDQNG
jgi:hypothetical protein